MLDMNVMDCESTSSLKQRSFGILDILRYMNASNLDSTTVKIHQLGTLAGIIAPVLFVGVFVLEGWLRSGYNSQTMFVSELSLGPRGWIQIANFIIFALLLFAFSWRVTEMLKGGIAAKAGPLFLAAVATCCLLSGIFVTDPGTIFTAQKSLHGIIHGIFGAVVFLIMPICCFVFLRHFWNDPQWRGLRLWTLVAGIVILAAVILLTIATKVSLAQNALAEWRGLIQRAAIIPYMTWLFIFALSARRSS